MRKGLRKVARAVTVMLAVGFALAAYVYLTIPDVRPLRKTDPRTTAFMELRAREARAQGSEPQRHQRWVPYSRISQNLVRAVLVAEDSAFWRHGGVDYEQMKESMEVNLERGEFVRGASTITQQLAKNLYLTPSKNLVRKAREILIARRLEAELSKQRILELYLNLIEWGDGIWGADAAARTYFRKPASDLSASEGALLAAAIINPRVLDPGQPSARLRRRQQMIMRRMGAATPPPVLADTMPTDPSIPTLPTEELPPVLPGTPVVPPEKPIPTPPCEKPPCR